jgi:ketosteroid isomerase-like protein
MTSNIEITKKLNEACMARDFATARSLLHTNYTLKDPQFVANSADEFIAFMQNCNSDARLENLSMVADGEIVVQVFDCVASNPVAYRVRMCAVLTFKDGKVLKEEMFYDTAAFPPEALNMQKPKVA